MNTLKFKQLQQNFKEATGKDASTHMELYLQYLQVMGQYELAMQFNKLNDTMTLIREKLK